MNTMTRIMHQGKPDDEYSADTVQLVRTEPTANEIGATLETPSGLVDAPAQGLREMPLG